MDNLIIERTPLVIAAEINMINQQTKKILLTNAVEIGRRLKEAKALVPHGKWLNWLAESVSYSKSTAENLMHLYEEYGPKLLASFDDGSNSQPVGNLSYTQALILLGFPEEEREQFIEDNDVGNMTKQELQQAIKDRDQAIQKKEDLQKELDDKKVVITDLTTQAKSLENQVSEYQQKYSAEQEKVTEKQTELDAVKEEIPFTRKINELEKELQTEKTKSSVTMAEAQFIFHRDNLIKAYEELQKILTALARTDQKKKEKNREAVCKMLTNMAKMLEVWPPVIKTNLTINTANPRGDNP